MRGAFIVLEGIDRSGKSTQIEQLLQSMDNCVRMNFPDRSGMSGQFINQYLANKEEVDDHVIHLMFSLNRWEQRAHIERVLAAGQSIVCDRYAYSGVCYSVAKGLDMEWCKGTDAGLPAPDLAVYLKLEPSAASVRTGYGGERYEVKSFQEKVAAAFECLMDSRPEARSVSAEQSIGAVAEQIQQLVANIDRSTPLSYLW